MCGRYTNLKTWPQLHAYYRLLDAEPVEWAGQGYNIAPTSKVPVILEQNGRRTGQLMRWGLLPFWAKDKKEGARMINARCETLEEKPAFRKAFQSSRCIIPATGFFEWQDVGAKTKQPFYFTPADALFSFAGLWSRWKSPEGEEMNTCAIITTTANEVVAPVHNRMPVVLGGDNTRAAWLAAETPAEDLKALLAPFEAAGISARKVSTFVSNVRNQGPDCIAELNSK